MTEPYRDKLIADLRTVAPVGTTVFVETATPGRVRLFVETGGQHNPVTHRRDGADDIESITQRVGALLDVEQNTSDDTIDGDIGIVSRLSLYLHGSTGSLFAAAASA
jgi:hypothetical protein